MRSFSRLCLVAALLGAAQVLAAEGKPPVSVGATKAELLDAYGPPTGRSAVGNIEILHYPTGQVRLKEGRVERLSLKKLPSAETLEPSISAPATVAPSISLGQDNTSPLAAVWIANFEDALREAVRRDSVVLALFTASDATPASRQFQKEIVFHPEFVNAFRARYVLLYVDSPLGKELPTELREQGAALRDRYGIQQTPALLLLSATGEKVAHVDIADSVPGSAFRGRLIAAVLKAFELPAPEPPVSPPQPVKVEVPVPSQLHVAPVEVTSGLVTARSLITTALIIGTVIAVAMLLVLWLVLRNLNKPAVYAPRSSMAARIAHAASGLPSFAEIRAWSKESLCTVVTRLAETEGYVAQKQPGESDKDLVLKRPHNPAPEIIVCCVTGNSGVIPTRRIREMVGMLAADDVPAGWFISPMGFTVDARAYAEQNNIRLIDAAGLLNRLGDLPTFALPNVLATVR